MPRGRKAVEGVANYGHRMLSVKEPALWDDAIRKAKAQGISLSGYVERLMREQVEREQKANTWDEPKGD